MCFVLRGIILFSLVTSLPYSSVLVPFVSTVVLSTLPYCTGMMVSYATSIIGTGNALFHLFSFFLPSVLYSVRSPIPCSLSIPCSLPNVFSVQFLFLCPLPCSLSYPLLCILSLGLNLFYLSCSLFSVLHISCYLSFPLLYLLYPLLFVLSTVICP